jgi:branched-chain amino acid transport system permease protein
MNLLVAVALSGLFSAGVGVAFGLPSLRIKGFYLAIATLAAQFFLVWLFQKWAWLYNYSASGAIQVANINMFGVPIAGPNATAMTQYYVVLSVVCVVTLFAINITRGRIGRMWKAVRDMDIAAELVGINLMKAKLSAFFVSSYIVGVAGALFVFMWRGAAEAELFDVQLSFRVLFIAIIGGLGSILGNYLGAILIVALPVLLNTVPRYFGLPISSSMVEHLNIMIIGSLIILFLIVEPHGLARYWAIIREKLIIWPFPH